ncbi:MAG TPA: NrfD/PsrC family molybdoenzyme membrane anchor subunit, partial [Ktedonobacterales bacterium]|nr:NrfD/PsrC family molybdoenzyme membrane anchor subunit [Ktedonobacterales bacterium]
MSLSKQQRAARRAPNAAIALVGATRDAAAGATDPAATYYQRPMIKRPTWKWYIPLYFFLGGVAGGAAAIGAAADLFGGRRHRATVRYARYLSMSLVPVCALLLIFDLGRPTRFHHMLRVFKGASPLSVGTWILSAFGLTSGVLAARQLAEDEIVIRRESMPGRLARLLPGRPFAAAHGVLGLALGGYTGVLLAATATPLWAGTGLLLGPIFLTAAFT